MSYCRCEHDSDFYVIRSGDIYLVYPARELVDHDNLEDKIFLDPRGLYNYLTKMKEKGYLVPSRVFERLDRERKNSCPDSSVG